MKHLGVEFEIAVLKLKNAAGSFVNTFANATTAARTWTLPDKSGTFAFLDDITGGSSSVTSISETPSGTLNGSNVTFTLSSTPINGSVVFDINGVVQKKTTDYSIAGTTITCVTAPASDAVIQAYYQSTITGGSSAIAQTVVDLGSTFTYSKKCTVNDANILTTSKILAFVTAKTGMSADELEMDNPTVSANCTNNGVINFYISCHTAIAGQYTINYMAG